jgi:hypothetical protein
MLTQAVPSIINALSGSLPPGALKQLTQSLGNCAQPVTQRGPVNINNGDMPTTHQGTVNGGGWNPNNYPGLFPPPGTQNIDMGGYNSTWNTNNYGGSQFYFPTNSFFTQNQYFGGPTTNIGGNSYFDNSYVTNLTTNNITTKNINVTYINGRGVKGDQGDTGPSGPPGEPGRDGMFDGYVEGIRYMTNVEITLTPGEWVDAATTVDFDPELCTVGYDPVAVPTTWTAAVTPKFDEAVFYAP